MKCHNIFCWIGAVLLLICKGANKDKTNMLHWFSCRNTWWHFGTTCHSQFPSRGWWTMNLTWVKLETWFGGGFKPFGNQVSVHFVYREMRLHTRASTQGGAFAQRWFYAERWFYKGMLLLTNVFTQRYFQHRDAFTHGCFKTQILLHRDDFAKRNF